MNPPAIKKLNCPNCGPTHGGRMVLRKRRVDDAPFWGCERFPACRATHGAHPDGKPLGIPGTMDVKAARRMAHAAFDRLWQEGGMHRNGAYSWLAEAMGLPRERTHIGEFGVEQCELVVKLATEKLDAVKLDPLRGERDQIRAVLREKFGHGFGAARRGRKWLGAALQLEGHALVHALDEEQCRKALELLETLPMPVEFSSATPNE